MRVLKVRFSEKDDFDCPLEIDCEVHDWSVQGSFLVAYGIAGRTYCWAAHTVDMAWCDEPKADG